MVTMHSSGLRDLGLRELIESTDAIRPQTRPLTRIAFLQSPAIAEDCYILVVLFFFYFYFFFRPPNFRHPWADFRETLPHDAVCAEIVYLL